MPFKNAYKEECGYIAKSTPFKDTGGNIPLMITFYPKTNIGDLDNMLSSIKAGIDDIAIAWAINDKRFRPITIDVGKLKSKVLKSRFEY